MLENQNKIDDLFNDFLHNYEEKPPAFVWNNIESELKIKTRVHTLYYIKAFAASIALFITFGLGYFVSDLNLSNNKAKKLKESENKHLTYSKLEVLEDSIEIKNANKSETNKSKKHLYKNTLSFKKSESQFRIANYVRIKIYDTNQLYRKYKFINENFIINKENKKPNNFIVNNSNEEKSNQLLTDTLLSEKESLHKGGFLLQKEENKKSTWSFGTKFSPVVAIGENNSTAGIQETTNDKAIKGAVRNERPDVDREEKPLTTYSGGINVNYHLSRRFSIESGVFYAQKKQGTDNLVGSLDNEFDGNQMTIYTPVGSQSVMQINSGTLLKDSRSTTYYNIDANYISNAEYIELPLIIRYKVIDQKISLDVMSGVSTNFLVKNSTSIILDNQELWSGQNKNISPILYGATFGLGVNYNFYQNFTFNLEPTLKYSLLPAGSVFSKYPYSFAVFAGFSFRFK